MDKSKTKSSLWQALSLAFELGYVIALPLVALGLGGRLLDRKFGTAPILFLVGIVVAVIVTSVWFVMKMKDFMKE